MKLRPDIACAVAIVMAWGPAHAEGGHMLDGSHWMTGYGGVWVPILLAGVAGLLIWIVALKRK